jgi:hypothetical protein
MVCDLVFQNKKKLTDKYGKFTDITTKTQKIVLTHENNSLNLLRCGIGTLWN